MDLVGGGDVASPATVTGVLRALATDYKINIYFGFGEYADKTSEASETHPEKGALMCVRALPKCRRAAACGKVSG